MTDCENDGISVIKPPEVAEGARKGFCQGTRRRQNQVYISMDMKIVVVDIDFSEARYSIVSSQISADCLEYSIV